MKRFSFFLGSLLALNIILYSCSSRQVEQFEYNGEYIHNDLKHISQIICLKKFEKHYNYFKDDGSYKNIKHSYILVVTSLLDGNKTEVKCFKLLGNLSSELSHLQIDSLYYSLYKNSAIKGISNLYNNLPEDFVYSYLHNVPHNHEYENKKETHWIDSVFQGWYSIFKCRKDMCVFRKTSEKECDTVYEINPKENNYTLHSFSQRNKFFFDFIALDDSACVAFRNQSFDSLWFYSIRKNKKALKPFGVLNIQCIPKDIKFTMKQTSRGFKSIIDQKGIKILWLSDPTYKTDKLATDFYLLKNDTCHYYNTDANVIIDQIRQAR